MKKLYNQTLWQLLKYHQNLNIKKTNFVKLQAYRLEVS